MGSGTWEKTSFKSYSASKNMDVSLDGTILGNYSAQEMFKQRNIASELDPKNVIRECCDSEEHPHTKPVILALDVTGSMGGASVKVAKELNVIMTELYDKVQDVEFMIMGIGDLAYDRAPIQASQFESDIRIAEQLDKVYFEGGGGGNSFESYTAAWYFGLNHCKLDCWERGKKGIIITLGDEPLNPYLPASRLSSVTGDKLQGDVETGDLYREVSQQYDVYHLAIADRETSYRIYADKIKASFGKYLDENHLKVVNMDSLASAIVGIVANSEESTSTGTVYTDENGAISW